MTIVRDVTLDSGVRVVVKEWKQYNSARAYWYLPSGELAMIFDYVNGVKYCQETFNPRTGRVTSSKHWYPNGQLELELCVQNDGTLKWLQYENDGTLVSEL